MTATQGLEDRVERILATAYDEGAFSAASCRIARDGGEVAEVTIGELAHLDRSGRPIPAGEQEKASSSTLFDLASVTKVFSAYTLLRLVEEGQLELERPLAETFPEYREGAKRRATLRHLLTHTSGLPATWDGWRGPMARIMRERPPAPGEWFVESPLSGQRDELVADLLRTPLTADPGSRWEYACTGYNTAMVLAERVTGSRWGDLVRRLTLEPLGLDEVTFHPDPDRTAATEYLPELGRGTVRGAVHDESSWSLGGECANAGLFGTSSAVLRLAEAIRRGESEILGTQMWENQLPEVLGRDYALDGDNHYGASLGLRIGELPWMGSLGSASRGHNGFTGTSLQTERETGVSIVLLTNRVHPSREGGSIQPLRARIADEALQAAREAAGS